MILALSTIGLVVLAVVVVVAIERIVQSGRSVGEFTVEISGEPGAAWDRLCRAVERTGWRLRDEDTDSFGNQVRMHESDLTPLRLGVFRYTDDSFGLVFVTHWLRCLLRGGWAKPGLMPKDIAYRVRQEISKTGSVIRFEVERGPT